MKLFRQAILPNKAESQRRTECVRNSLALVLALLMLTGCRSDNQTGKKTEATKDDPVEERAKPDAANDQSNSSEPQPEPPQEVPAVSFDPLELLGSVEADVLSVEAIAFAPDNETFVTGGNTPQIWKVGSDEPLHIFDDLYPLTGTIVRAEGIAISSDGSILAIGGGDGITHLFDLATKKPLRKIDSNEGGVVSVSFSRDGNTLATSGYDGQAKVWNTSTGEQIVAMDIEQAKRVRSAISPDGKMLVSVGEDALVWSAESGEKLGDLNIGEPRAMSVWAVGFSSDGKQIATGEVTADFENAALIWSTDTHKLVSTLKHEYSVWHVGFSPDGTLIATGDVNGVARIWRLADQQLVQTIALEEANAMDALAWTPDGQLLAVASDGTVRFWGHRRAIETDDGAVQRDDSNSESSTPQIDTGVDDGKVAQNESGSQGQDGQADLQNADSDPELDQPQPPAANMSFGNVTPLTTMEAIALVDVTQFPAPGGTPPSSYSRRTSAIFNLRGEFPTIVEKTEQAFEDLNWSIVARDESSEDSVAFYLHNQQLLLACKVRQERKSRSRMDIELLGNLDIRSIPKMEVQEVLHDYLDYVVYSTTASLDDVSNFYDRLLTEHGWQRYRQFDGHDFSDSNRRHAMYRNGGMGVNVSADLQDGRILASLYCSMLEQDVPTPTDATEIELDDHLIRQRFRSTQTVGQLVSFFTAEMQRFGWTMPFGKQFEDLKAGMYFTRPDGDPVYLELLSREDGTTVAYMAGPTRQVSRAVKGEFEIDYEQSLPIGETQMHTIPYQSIPFYEPLEDGSGRTIAETVFFNTVSSLEEIFDFYRSHFSELGWEPGQRNNERIGDELQRATITFSKSDAEIVVTAGPWIEDTNRVVIEGNGIEWPGDAFCQMMARKDEATDIQWPLFSDGADGN